MLESLIQPDCAVVGLSETLIAAHLGSTFVEPNWPEVGTPANAVRTTPRQTTRPTINFQVLVGSACNFGSSTRFWVLVPMCCRTCRTLLCAFRCSRCSRSHCFSFRIFVWHGHFAPLFFCAKMFLHNWSKELLIFGMRSAPSRPHFFKCTKRYPARCGQLRQG